VHEVLDNKIGAAQYSSVGQSSLAIAVKWEVHHHETGPHKSLSRSLQYRPTLDYKALSIIAYASKFQRSSVTLDFLTYALFCVVIGYAAKSGAKLDNIFESCNT